MLVPSALSDNRSNGEVMDIDPATAEQPSPEQVPETYLGLSTINPLPSSNEPLFDPTTAQRIRHQRLVDEARRSQDYNADLGILEPEENDVILNTEHWEDIMI